MAFWKRKTATTPPAPSAPAAPSSRTPAEATSRKPEAGARVLLRPHLTEKSSVLAERGQYTFLVTGNAEKTAIARDVAARYGVHPVRVHIINLPGKEVRYGKTTGHRRGVRKAVVTLTEGEKIPFGVKT